MSDSLEQINREMLLEGAKLFPKRTFILGEGPTGARVLFTGESPGPPDAVSGSPFQGPVGDMMNKILGSIGLVREECYLTNVVKLISRGKDLTPDILAFFAPYLHREIMAVAPGIIVTLGATPAQVLLGTSEPISKVRGEFYDYHGIPLMPTFNPAYLLRDPSRKREVWEDMKKVRDLGFKG
jgi:DNA polymerase